MALWFIAHMHDGLLLFTYNRVGAGGVMEAALLLGDGAGSNPVRPPLALP